MIVTKGIDYAWSHPNVLKIPEDYSFVARYYSHDTSKLVNPLEALAICSTGRRLVTVWEDSANRAVSGPSSGTVDGNAAKFQAVTDHQPTTSPIYIAVDYDAPQGDWANIAAYVDAFQKASGYPVGLYGDYFICDQMYKDGHVQYIWQTIAWSSGRVHPEAHIYQTGEQIVIDGVTCDVNYAEKEDYGSWTIASEATIQEEPGISYVRTS